MKSKVMQKGAPQSFTEDAKLLAETPSLVFHEMVVHIEASCKKGVVFDADLLVPLAEKHSIPMRNLSDSLRVASFIANEVAREGDKVDDILDDLVSMEAFSKAQSEDVAKKLDANWSALVGSVTDAMHGAYELNATLPSLTFCNISCALVGRYYPEFDHLKNNPTSYAPKVVQLIPTAIVQIDVYRYGDTDRVSFAQTEMELDELISRLQSAKVKLKVLGEQVGERK